MNRNNKPSGYFKLLADISTIGLNLAASVFVGFAGGYFIDIHLFAGKTKPWFMFIFLGLGIFAGFRSLMRLASRKDL